jgi:tetratricopeptide (TPR) repeat protein
VAREYAIQLRKKALTTSIFWVQAHTVLQFKQDYLKIAAHPDILGEAACSSADTISTIATIGRYLSSSEFGNWLIIVDNVNDEAIFFNQNSPLDLIPVCLSGSVIFTTRNKKMGLKLVGFHGDNAIEVKSFDPIEAKRLLLIRTGFNELNDDEEKASELVAALEYLPLAISQAGGFIAVHKTPVAEYLRLYNATELSKIELLSDDSFESQSLDHEYFINSAPVATTLMMSLHKMRKSDRDLLAFMSCLALRGTPKNLLLDNVRGDEIKLTKALGSLGGYCLITEREKGIFNMHGLVYLVIRNWLRSTNMFDHWKAKSFTAVAGKFPSWRNRERGTLSIGDLYLPHAETVLRYIETPTIKDTARAELAIRCSRHAQMQGLYGMAEVFAKRAVDWGTSEYGQYDPETLANRSFLATTLRDQGKFQEAKDTDMEVLSRGKEKLSKDHPVILFSMESLSLTLSGLGMHQQAEKLQRCLLKRRIHSSGLNDIETLTTMNNLVTSLQAQGKWGEAKALGEETVQRKREVFGNGDLDTLLSVSNLALVLQQTGDIDEAETKHREVLEGRVNQLRKNHPLILVSINNIGVVLHQKRQFAAAEDMYRQAWDGAQGSLGVKNPWTITMMQNLSEVLFEQGKYDEAEDLSQQVVADRKIILGTDHEKTLSSGRTLKQIKAAKLANRAEVLGQQSQEPKNLASSPQPPLQYLSSSKVDTHASFNKGNPCLQLGAGIQCA